MKILEFQFNLPTADCPVPKKENAPLEEGPILIEDNLFENFTATMDGIVKPDANILIFELVDVFGSFFDSNKLKYYFRTGGQSPGNTVDCEFR